MAATSAADGGRHAQDEERARVPTEGEPDGVRRLAHTADTGISVTAPTFDLCLARAAAGMFAGFLRPTSEAARTVRTDVELEADSRTELLVRWLEELLYRSDSDGLAFVEFEAHSKGGNRLQAAGWAVPFDAAVEQVGPVVKAVTRHGLELRKDPSGWRAQIFFDV